jgi:hypothetical protein
MLVCSSNTCNPVSVVYLVVKVIRDVTAFDITVVYLVVVDVMVDVTIVVAVCWKILQM